MADDNTLIIADDIKIQNMIHTIRGQQVMIDRDLAELYNVETKVMNQAVKRNISRFPENFRFQLNDLERNELVTNCDRFKMLKHSSSNPYAFTEQGIAMLSAVLKSDIAIEVSIKIMNSFIEMRRFLLTNAELFSRLDKAELRQMEFEKKVELKQLETDKKFEEVFNYIAANTEVKQKIFFNGQIYDAFSLMVELVTKAENELILVDNYVDVNTLNILCKKNTGVNVLIVTAGKGKLSAGDITKFNSQYPKLTVKENKDFHDRFLIIDKKEVYHIGASVKDAGKKSFGITKLEEQDLIDSLLSKVI